MNYPSILIAIVVQTSAGWLLLFAPFGFDIRSEWGLDFDHFVLISFAYGVAFLYGMGVAIARRVWWAIAVQLIGVVILLTPPIKHRFFDPPPPVLFEEGDDI